MPKNHFQKRERERVAAECRIRGWTLEKTAREIEARGLGQVSTVAVLKMLRRIDARADAAMVNEVAESRRRQLETLRYIQHEMLDAWHRSKEDAQRVKERTTEADGPPAPPPAEANGHAPALATRLAPRKVKTTDMQVEGRVGERGYAETALKALEQERKILGYDAPAKADITTDGQALGPPAIGWIINPAPPVNDGGDDDSAD